MFKNLKTAIFGLIENTGRRDQCEDKDGRIAAAALLVRVATVNSEMSATRRENLHAVLKSGFALDDPTTVHLIADALRPSKARLTSTISPVNSMMYSAAKAVSVSLK